MYQISTQQFSSSTYSNFEFQIPIFKLQVYQMQPHSLGALFVFVPGFIACYFIWFKNTAYPTEFYQLTGVISFSSSSIYLFSQSPRSWIKHLIGVFRRCLKDNHQLSNIIPSFQSIGKQHPWLETFSPVRKQSRILILVEVSHRDYLLHMTDVKFFVLVCLFFSSNLLHKKKGMIFQLVHA